MTGAKPDVLRSSQPRINGAPTSSRCSDWRRSVKHYEDLTKLLKSEQGIGSSPIGIQCSHDQSVRILTKVADSYRPVGNPERLFVMAELKLLLG